MPEKPVEKRLRILRIIARLNIGGPAIQAVSLTKRLSSAGYITLLVCGKVGAKEGDMGYLAEEQGVRPFVIPQLGREISVADDLRAFLALRRLVKHFRPHIIHTHTAKAGTLGRLAALSINSRLPHKDRIKLVHTFHGHIFQGYFGPRKSFLFILIERLLGRFTDRIITISTSQRKDICHHYGIGNKEKVKIVPLGFDLSGFKECRHWRDGFREKYLPRDSSEAFLVGTVGRLAPVKNPFLLLNAIEELKKRGRLDRFRFLIVGDGELKQKLIDQARALGVSEALRFAGWQRYMAPVYGGIDALAITSKNEGTPVAAIEAMASAIPVVATDVGGVRDLMGDNCSARPEGFSLARNGIIFPPGDSRALSSALLFLLEHRQRCAQVASNAREFALKHYSLERLLRDIDALYIELVCGRAAESRLHTKADLDLSI